MSFVERNNMDDTEDSIRYAGFWIRVAAAIIDSLLWAVITIPILIAIYGIDWLLGELPAYMIHGTWELLLSYLLPAIVVIVFWVCKSATPGKMITRIKVVDAETGNKLSTGQRIGRYLASYPATLPLFSGLIWVAFDKRKQGWHDKLARTLVVEV